MMVAFGCGWVRLSSLGWSFWSPCGCKEVDIVSWLWFNIVVGYLVMLLAVLAQMGREWHRNGCSYLRWQHVAWGVVVAVVEFLVIPAHWS